MCLYGVCVRKQGVLFFYLVSIVKIQAQFMCFRPTLGERTHMHAHTHANIYGVGVEVNVTSCSPASESLQLCLNPAVT